MDEADQKILDDIERFGCSVMHIAAEDDLPPFAFSMGISKTSSAPEVVVVGLKQPLAHFVVNEYNRRVRAGEAFVAGQTSAGFIDGFDVLFDRVHASNYEEYFGYNLWLYEGPNFEVLQIVFPNTSGVWPWDEIADPWFRARQPLLRLPAEPQDDA
ncbi:DUF4262 domain-containing protein [Pseudaquabacterium rugosum]|uniref:DUF4262 domain-containing protein n=1 Tax=Pseudaquabacterium rugosum TaxID=2984194 RepID=A0ABU9BFV9_9BURK